MTGRTRGAGGAETTVPDWTLAVPKVELHFHLEGAIPLDTLWSLIAKYGGSDRAVSREALEDVFRYSDFPAFIETWLWKHSYLREPDDLVLVAADAARQLTRQGVVYAEAFYSPSDLASTGMSPQLITEALRRGLDSVPEVEVALIADLVRDAGPARAGRTLAAVHEARDLGVIGVGLGGSEHAFPAPQFAGVFERARDLGFRTTAHAGEAAGAESVWSAIRDLRVERIGHGIRAVEDPSLVAFLAETRLPLEVCPGSNVATGVVPSLAAHPIRRLFEAGVLVTVGTDDPGMFGNTLVGEFAGVERELGFAPREIATLILNGVEASWLPAERKQELRAAVAAALAATVGRESLAGTPEAATAP